MSQNKGKVKKVHPVEKNNLAFDYQLYFFGEIDQKLKHEKDSFI